MRGKMLLFLAVLGLFVAGALAGAAERDTRLEAAFESDALVLAETALIQDLSGYTLRARTAYYEAVLKGSLPGVTPVYSGDGAWVSFALTGSEMLPAPRQCFFSPDGGKALCMDKQIAYVAEGKTITIISYSHERSVQDEYGQYAAFAKLTPDRWVGAEGVVWSPDGRYAVLTNFAEVFFRARFVYGLYIIDTVTGELFCADTYPTKLKEKWGAVMQACFGPAGRQLYYVLYGSAYGDAPVSLMCYDVETGQKQRLLACQKRSAYPMLQMGGSGSLMNLADSPNASEPLGLNVYTQRDGVWSMKTYALPQTSRIAYPIYFDAGPAGFGVLLDRILPANQGKSVTMAGQVRLEDGYPGLGEFLLIDSPDAPYATRISLLSYGDGSLLDGRLAEGTLWQCLNIKLSPDGRYALLLVGNSGEFAFLMMDMETLALRRVTAPDGLASTAAVYNVPVSNAYPSGFNWFLGNKLVFNGTDGLKLCEFAY